MTFNDFWVKLSAGGNAKLKHGGTLTFSVEWIDGKEKLHIQSTNSKNENYYIEKETAEQYFNDPTNPNHSWFNTVFQHLNP
jgi:hypothetical protein